MAVVLPRTTEAAWLDPALTDPTAGCLRRWPVSLAVNRSEPAFVPPRHPARETMPVPGPRPASRRGDGSGRRGGAVPDHRQAGGTEAEARVEARVRRVVDERHERGVAVAVQAAPQQIAPDAAPLVVRAHAEVLHKATATPSEITRAAPTSAAPSQAETTKVELLSTSASRPSRRATCASRPSASSRVATCFWGIAPPSRMVTAPMPAPVAASDSPMCPAF